MNLESAMPAADEALVSPTIPKIVVKGHQRSGNNLFVGILGSLICGEQYDSCTFSDGDDHSLLAPESIDPAVKYVYVQREFKPVAASVFCCSALYGFGNATFEDFLTSKYCDLYTPGSKQLMYYMPSSGAQLPEIYHSHNAFFANIPHTPGEWHSIHLDHYQGLASRFENIRIIHYQSLVGDQKAEMQSLFDWLGLPASDLSPTISKPVGWFPADKYVKPSLPHFVESVGVSSAAFAASEAASEAARLAFTCRVTELESKLVSLRAKFDAERKRRLDREADIAQMKSNKFAFRLKRLLGRR